MFLMIRFAFGIVLWTIGILLSLVAFGVGTFLVIGFPMLLLAVAFALPLMFVLGGAILCLKDPKRAGFLSWVGFTFGLFMLGTMLWIVL